MSGIDPALAEEGGPARRGPWASVIAAAFLAVAVVAGIDIMVSGRYNAVPEMASGGGGAARQAEAAANQGQFGAILYGTLGGLLGLGLGLAGGISRRCSRAALIAGLLGGIGSGAAGALASGAMVGFYDRNEVTTPDEASVVPMEMIIPLAAHAGIWVPLGAIAGLALGVGAAGKAGAWRGLAGGLAGALVATLLHEVLGAIAFPASGAELPVPNGFDARVLASALVAILVASVATGSVLSATKRAERAPVPGLPSGSPAQ